MFRKTPGFSVAVVFTLALTIGANAAIYSVVHAVLLKQLPFREPDRLTAMWSRRTDGAQGPLNVGDFVDFRDRNTTFDEFSAYTTWNANLTRQGDAERLPGMRATANFFRTLGSDVALDDTERVVAISDGLWRRRFGGVATIIGESIILDGAAYAVVSVLPPDFVFPIRDAEFVAPYSPDRDPLRTQRNSVNFLRVVGRLKPGVTVARAQDDLTGIAKQLQREYPDANARKIGAIVLPLADELVGPVRAALVALMAAVAGVLLIACANLASLMLARGSSRRKEMAIRLATGATRGRLLRQLLTEAMVFGLIGGVLGIGVAAAGVNALVALAPADLPRLNQVAIDAPVLGFTTALSLVAAVVFGSLPAIVVSRANVSEELKADARGASEGRDRRRARAAMVVAEVALALALLIAVGLLARSFFNVLAVNPGFDSRQVLTARLSLPATRYDTPQKVMAYVQQVSDRLSAVRGVRTAGAVSLLPLNGVAARVPFTPADRAIDHDRVPTAQYRLVSPDYFRAMGIPILRGRTFAPADTTSVPPVAAISDSLARRYFAGRNPIGAHLTFDDNNDGPRSAEIVAVVGDVKQIALDSPATMDLYLPYSQVHTDAVAWATANMFWTIRVDGDPMALAESVRKVMQSVDRQVPIAGVRPLDRYLAASLAPRRFNIAVLAVFALAALVLAASGIYATLSYSVAQRSREIAIRMALGARARDIVQLVIAQGLTPAIAGVIVGLSMAIALTRFVSGLLFDVSAGDPATFVSIAGVLLVVACAACLVPALRAARTPSLR